MHEEQKTIVPDRQGFRVRAVLLGVAQSLPPLLFNNLQGCHPSARASLGSVIESQKIERGSGWPRDSNGQRMHLLTDLDYGAPLEDSVLHMKTIRF